MLQEIISEFSEVSAYNINTEESIVFVYIINEPLEVETNKL